jgi:rhamnosyltransferase
VGSEEQVKLSIVIPAKNEALNISQCLDAIYRQETSFSYEIILIDSGSTDQTVDIIHKYPGVRLLEIPAEEFGHGKTRNLGAQKGRGEFIVFINADAVPTNNNWLNELILPFEKDRHIAGVFSRHLPKTGCLLYMARDLLTSMPDKPLIRSKKSTVDFMIFSTVSCAIRRDIWESFPFKDDILIAEDQEWGQRVLANGYKIVYQPKSSVFHSHNYSADELYVLKHKVSRSTSPFKHRISAYIIGFIMMVAGIKLKFSGDFFYIMFNPMHKGLSFKEKRRQLGIALKARIASFRGRYHGWIQK